MSRLLDSIDWLYVGQLGYALSQAWLPNSLTAHGLLTEFGSLEGQYHWWQQGGTLIRPWQLWDLEAQGIPAGEPPVAAVHHPGHRLSLISVLHPTLTAGLGQESLGPVRHGSP